MKKERIPVELFNYDGHYLGSPADFEDRIIKRRLRLVDKVVNFTGKEYTLLDIGCGNGASMFGLANKMKYCLGIDITDKHLQEFNLYKTTHDIKNCDFLLLDIEKNELPVQYDRIISFEVIEHLENEESLKSYYQFLVEGGKLAISVPNKWWIFETHGAKLPFLKWNRVPFFSWLPRLIHEKYANARIYTKSRIVQLLENHGFNVVSTEYITAPMDVLKEGKLKRFLINNFFNSDTTWMPWKATSIFVVAEKKYTVYSNV